MKFNVLRVRDMSYFVSINLFHWHLKYFYFFLIQAESKT